jgi:two-component system LytT family sensor kinase
LFTKKIHLNLLTYAGIVAFSHGSFYYRRYHERNAQLARARLQTLQMQLQPHFLFNTLNTISELVHRDSQAADRTIAKFGDLLRLSARNRKSAGSNPQGRNSNFCKNIWKSKKRVFTIVDRRFYGRAETLDACLPNMILQPLLENAIRHGIAARPGAGKIHIRSERRGEMLELRISDNGNGLAASNDKEFREGIGLSNTRARLKQLYGERQKLILHASVSGGLEVVLQIPFHQQREKKIN